MNVSKTNKKTQDIASSGEVHLHMPTAWHELSQEQLRYILTLMSEGVEGAALKTFMLIRFNNITIHSRNRNGWYCSRPTPKGRKEIFTLHRNQVVAMVDTLNFIDTLEDMDVRLDGINGLQAVDELLHGVPFGDYLKMEIAYQGFLKSKAEQPLRSLARLLYRDQDGHTVDGTPYSPAELLGAHLWFAHVKAVLAREFPDFFRPASGEALEDFDALDAYNAQIRALTDGDVTKEDTVRAVDTWRALTELNAKAVDAREMRKRLNSPKS